MTPLEKVNSMKMPFAELKGVTFTEAERDRVVGRMLIRPDLCTLGHTIHGGAIMAFADSVGAVATVINLPDGAKGTTTIESKTNFIGGAKEGATLVATATPVHRGRRTQVWQTRLETEDGKFVPDFTHRFLTEDVPFGLVVLRGIAEIAGVPTPKLDTVLCWSQQKLGKEYLVGSRLIGKDIDATRCPQRYGYSTMEDVLGA